MHQDPLGNWMTLWTTPTLDNTIQNLYYKFNQYRYNTPDICQTPFFTNHIRYEIDTRDVSGWSEFDFFELHGLPAVDASMVNWYGKGKWDVIYVPHKDASGLDSFTYSASDCPGTDTSFIIQNVTPDTLSCNVRKKKRILSFHQSTHHRRIISIGTSRVGFTQRWSPNVGTININIVPVGTSSCSLPSPTCIISLTQSTHHTLSTYSLQALRERQKSILPRALPKLISRSGL
jgi:hypothetical protein